MYTRKPCYLHLSIFTTPSAAKTTSSRVLGVLVEARKTSLFVPSHLHCPKLEGFW